MTTIPISMARRHILGDIASRCERIDNVPVHLNDPSGQKLGYADESLGSYADAITFHLEEPFNKRVSMGHFTYMFEYEHADIDPANGEVVRPGAKRIRVSSIQLVERKGYAKPIARSKATTEDSVNTLEPTN